MSESLDPLALVQELSEVVADLRWFSETDAPFQVMVWPGEIAIPLTPSQILATAQLPPETSVVAMDLETFLAPALQPQPWHTATEQVQLVRYQTLETLLQKSLTNLQVYRCGTLELDIFIVGQAANGQWIILQTVAVET